ncbi:MAG: hypothetical protein ACI8Y4_005235 [Candidatus Poriferisodalaceae bacterium]
MAAHTFIEVGPFVEFDQRSDSAGAEPPADELCPAEVFDRIAEVGHLPVKYASDPGLVVEEVPGAKVTVDDCGSFRWCRWVSGQPAEATLEGCGRGRGSLLQGSCPAADLGRGKLIGLGARAEQVGGRDDGVDIGEDPGLLLGEFLAFCLAPGIAEWGPDGAPDRPPVMCRSFSAVVPNSTMTGRQFPRLIETSAGDVEFRGGRGLVGLNCSSRSGIQAMTRSVLLSQGLSGEAAVIAADGVSMNYFKTKLLFTLGRSHIW